MGTTKKTNLDEDLKSANFKTRQFEHDKKYQKKRENAPPEGLGPSTNGLTVRCFWQTRF
jgi:hypothetical protein